MKFLSNLMARAIVGLSFAMMFGGLFTAAYVSLLSPWQPDPRSGHIIPLKIFVSRYNDYLTVYVTNSGLTLYHVGDVFLVSGLLVIFAYLVVTRKLKRPTSFG